jgi:anti-sigma regulatory factor (Ser/Thr protein kinase)
MNDPSAGPDGALPGPDSQAAEVRAAEVRAAEVRVPHRPDSVPATRAFLARLLDGWGVEGSVIDDASLLASELMTNAVRHGRGNVRLRVETEGGRLHVAVHDDRDKRPVVNHVSAASPGGRGMWIVETIARDWGTDDDGDTPGKTVWFELTTVDAQDDS